MKIKNQKMKCIDDSDNDEFEAKDLNEELKLSFYSIKQQFMNFVTVLRN